MTSDNVHDSIDTAVWFVASQPDGPARILTVHDRLPDGSCGGCLTSSTRWPCPVAAIALTAARVTTLPQT